nr:EOG090X0A90 [Triops cancriformis]
MSHQTGIKANQELREFISKCRDGSVRYFKVSITNEELAMDCSGRVNGSWEDDFRSLSSLVKDAQPAYILFRLDSTNSGGYEWLLVTWSPDSSPVREKMLYASTKATLKNNFGHSFIKNELFCSTKEELSLKHYKIYLRSMASPAPLTNAEEELAEVRKHENRADVGVGTRQATCNGIFFPFSDSALKALLDFENGKYDYVQLSLDTKEETLNLEKVSSDTSVHSLPTVAQTKSGGYHLYRFPHTHEGDYLQSCVFVYSMPGSSSPIKERMLYSSCKGPTTEVLEKDLHITIDKKVEVESADELTEAFLMDELHPPKNLHRPKFAKPKGPPGRGARRLIKKAEDEAE